MSFCFTVADDCCHTVSVFDSFAKNSFPPLLSSAEREQERYKKGKLIGDHATTTKAEEIASTNVLEYESREGRMKIRKSRDPNRRLDPVNLHHEDAPW
jgi:hypothetical protein